MKESYKKQVAKSLSVSRRQKREILRDIDEIFASAREHNEGEAEVLARLGTPKAFARNIEEQLPGGRRNRKGRARRWGIALTLAAGTAAFLVYAWAVSRRPPANAIGYAEGSTLIMVESDSSLQWIFLGVGALSFLAAAVLIVAARRKKGEGKQ